MVLEPVDNGGLNKIAVNPVGAVLRPIHPSLCAPATVCCWVAKMAVTI